MQLVQLRLLLEEVGFGVVEVFTLRGIWLGFKECFLEVQVFLYHAFFDGESTLVVANL